MSFYYRVLYEGLRGRDVFWLQSALWWLNYYNGEISGVYTSSVKQAVIQFQTDRGITTDGIYGPITHSHLDSIVKSYQTKLKNLGFYRGSIDGRVGILTITATKSFQRSYRLIITGKITPATKQRLDDTNVSQPSRNLVRGLRTFVSQDTISATPTSIINYTITRNFSAIVVHYSASPDVSASTIRQWHLNKGFSDIGYHFVIRSNGNIEVGRSVNTVGAHTRGHNNYTVGICLTGSNSYSWYPTSSQITSLKRLIREIMNKQTNCKKVFLHRELNYTNCPGRLTKSQILG